MKRLTHMELAALQGSAREHVLWEHAIPLVKLTVGRMARGGSIRREDVDDDLLQEGMLIAGKAIKTWRPIECAFSTHIVTWVRGELQNYLNEKRNGGIGGRDQAPAVLSLQDKRDDVPRDEDDEEDDGTFEAALSYEGVVQSGGQFDGMGEIPEGFGAPEDEADRDQLETAIRAVIGSLRSPRAKDALNCIHGISGPAEHPEAYADRLGINRATVFRWLADARKKMRQKLSNSFS